MSYYLQKVLKGYDNVPLCSTPGKKTLFAERKVFHTAVARLLYWSTRARTDNMTVVLFCAPGWQEWWQRIIRSWRESLATWKRWWITCYMTKSPTEYELVTLMDHIGFLKAFAEFLGLLSVPVGIGVSVPDNQLDYFISSHSVLCCSLGRIPWGSFRDP